MGIFQGAAELYIDGVTSNVIFRLTGLDGERPDAASQDHLTLKVYAANASPNTDAPIYQVDAPVLRGSIKISKW